VLEILLQQSQLRSKNNIKRGCGRPPNTKMRLRETHVGLNKGLVNEAMLLKNEAGQINSAGMLCSLSLHADGLGWDHVTCLLKHLNLRGPVRPDAIRIHTNLKLEESSSCKLLHTVDRINQSGRPLHNLQHVEPKPLSGVCE